VLAGEEQSRTLLRDALGDRARERAVEVEHSGAPSGGEDEELAGAVAAAARDLVTADRLAVLDRFDRDAGRPNDLAATGLIQVIAALRSEAVDTLLLDGGVERDASVWVGDTPTQLARDADELRSMGSERAERVPVDAALLAAAAASGASFQPLGGGRTGLVGKPVEDGVAALLRFPLSAVG
jgi:hypothetical protein